ncbi:MAG: hypothetical protein WBH44_07840 [Proteocatella sp.]
MKKILYVVALMSEISLVAAVFILEKLASKKAGVNHHVLARRHQWEATVFSSENKNIIGFALVVILVGLMVLLINYLIKKRNLNVAGIFYKIQIIFGMLAAVVALMSQRTSFFLEMKTAPYMTFVAIAVLGIQILVLVSSSSMSNRKGK